MWPTPPKRKRHAAARISILAIAIVISLALLHPGPAIATKIVDPSGDRLANDSRRSDNDLDKRSTAPKFNEAMRLLVTTSHGSCGDVPLSLLPSEGFTTSGSLVTLWSHGALEDNAAISDFLPDDSDFAASRISEPTTLAALVVGAVGLGMIRCRRNGDRARW